MSEPMPDLHDEGCDCAIYGGGNREWVAANGDWQGDEHVCTCYLKAVMERRAVYGDERLVGELFPVLPPGAEGRHG